MHRLPAQVKLVAVLSFVLAVVLTPREAFWAFGAFAGMLLAVGVVARVPPRFLLRRMVVEVPFLVFAALLPFIAEGPTVEVAGLTLSQEGLLAGWNIVAKATLGVVASILLAATTEASSLLIGLQRLRVPPLLVEIASFMVRYGDVVASDLSRMRIALASRGYQARNVRQVSVLAASAGSLFIRSYERGERVHLAMLARAYQGRMPDVEAVPVAGAQWLVGAALPVGAAVVAALAWATT